MCRIVALPPGFPREKALAITKNFYLGNEDGTGSVYLKDGQFVTNRYNFSFEEVMKKRLPLFDHMPYNGWTLAHVRAASHGRNTIFNTHPFVKGDYAMIHNGVFREYAPVKAALAAAHPFEGETDTEVAATLWQVAGKKNFAKCVDSGVFMVLNKTGRVDVICNSGGDLAFQKTKWGVVMASELPDSYQRKHSVLEGKFLLAKNGKFVYSKWEKDYPSSWNYGYLDYGDYFPKKQKWKVKKIKKNEKISLDDLTGSEFDPDDDDFLEAQSTKRGYILV